MKSLGHIMTSPCVPRRTLRCRILCTVASRLLQPADSPARKARRLLIGVTNSCAGAFSILPCKRDGADMFTTDDRLKVLTFTGSPAVCPAAPHVWRGVSRLLGGMACAAGGLTGPTRACCAACCLRAGAGAVASLRWRIYMFPLRALTLSTILSQRARAAKPSMRDEWG